MKEVFFDGPEVIERATESLIWLYRIRDGGVPDACLRIPDDFDPHVPATMPYLETIRQHIIEALEGIFIEEYPTLDLKSIELPTDIIGKVIWLVHENLKMEPCSQVEHIGSYTALPELPELTTYHRVTPDEQSLLREEYRSMLSQIDSDRCQRLIYLEECISAPTDLARESLFAYIEKIEQHTAHIRQDLARFCARHTFYNPFQSRLDHDLDPDNELSYNYWREIADREELTELFSLSKPEKQLVILLPKEVRHNEKYLFEHTPLHIEDIERVDYDTLYHNEERLVIETTYERKLYIAYWAYRTLVLHRKGSLSLTQKYLNTVNIYLPKLLREIEELRSRVAIYKSSHTMPHSSVALPVMSTDFEDLGGFITSLGNKISRMNEKKIEVPESLLHARDVLSNFLHDAGTLFTDDDLDIWDKRQTITDTRNEVLPELSQCLDELSQLLHMDLLEHDVDMYQEIEGVIVLLERVLHYLENLP